MRLLLDTHYLIWLATSPRRIMESERRMIVDANNEILGSLLSVWEIRIKWNSRAADGERKGVLSPDEAVMFASENRIALESLTVDDLVCDFQPRLPHRDPFDEMLLVQARRLGAKLLTRDDKLRHHPLALAP